MKIKAIKYNGEFDHIGYLPADAPEAILEEDRKSYGENATGWGELSDYSIGQLKSGEYVFVSNI
jgi:hypothetical protein